MDRSLGAQTDCFGVGGAFGGGGIFGFGVCPVSGVSPMTRGTGVAPRLRVPSLDARTLSTSRMVDVLLDEPREEDASDDQCGSGGAVQDLCPECPSIAFDCLRQTFVAKRVESHGHVPLRR